MEDSTLEGWLTPPAPPPPGRELGYPDGYKLPSGPAAGWVGELRTTTQATDDAIKYAARQWPQVQPEDFERTGRRRYVERAAGEAFDLCHGNPLYGDSDTADVFSVEDGALVPAPRRPAAGAQPVHGLDGRDDAGREAVKTDWAKGIETFGPDFDLFPSSDWGRRDWALAKNRYQPLGKTLPPPAAAHDLGGFRVR